MAQCALNRVHDLPKPTREAMLARSPSVHQFWNHNKGLLETAWQEWEAAHGDPSLTLDRTLDDNKIIRKFASPKYFIYPTSLHVTLPNFVVRIFM